jgi:putative phosphoesterase
LIDFERFESAPEFQVGVISDTHIPDRTRRLPNGFLSDLDQYHLDLILHAGDISVPRVLDELKEIAPVLAVKGNRDLVFGNELPISRSLEINGHKVFLSHGHMGAFSYWMDKFQHVVKGYRSDRYIKRLMNAAPDASVYIFGHSHSVEEIRQDGKLFFNPGSVTFALLPETRKSWGLLSFSSTRVESQIHFLD